MDWSCIQLFKCLTLALNLACPVLTLTTQHAFTWAAQDRRSTETAHAQTPSNPTQSLHSTSFTSLTHSHIYMQDHTRRVSILHIYFYDRFIQEFFILDIFMFDSRAQHQPRKNYDWPIKVIHGSSSYMPTWIIILKLIICLRKLLAGFLALLPIRASHIDSFGI